MDSLMVLTMPESTVHGPSSAVATDGSSRGRSAPDDSAEALREAIGTLRSGADVQVCPVAMPGDLDGALHRRGSRTLVVAGGDAGLHSVVSALHRRNELDDAVLALLPAGPGGARSAFARGAGIPTNPVRAADLVLSGTERRFDMLMDCRGEVIVNGARVACRSDRTSRALAGLGSVPGVGALRGAARAASRRGVALRGSAAAPGSAVATGSAATGAPGGDGADVRGGVRVADAPPRDAPRGSPRDGVASSGNGSASSGNGSATYGDDGSHGQGTVPPRGAAPTAGAVPGPGTVPGPATADDLRAGAMVGPLPSTARSLGELAARSLRVQVVADDEVITDLDRPVLGVQVNNCAGPDPHVAGFADPCDGYADVVVSFAAQGMRRLRLMQRALRPGESVATEVLRLRARTVSVAGQWFSLASDGEDAGAEQRCTWQVLPGSLRVLVPPPGPE